MKTVKSIADLKSMALRTGASVAMGGDRYNTAGMKVIERPRERQTETPPPAAPPAPTMDTAPLAHAQEKIGAMLAHAIASLPQPGEPVREWLFTVERDSNGLLTQIRATAQE